MSGVERYIGTDPYNEGVLADIVARRHRLEKGGRTLYLSHSLAFEWGEAGTQGLRDIATQSTKEGVHLFLAPRNEGFKKLSEELKAKFLVNYAAVWFDIAMRAIETMIVDGYFDPNELNENAFLPLQGTKVAYKKMAGERIQLQESVHQKIIASAYEDKSHAVFFEEGFKLLPPDLRGYLIANSSLELIRALILPHYKKYAPLVDKSIPPFELKREKSDQDSDLNNTEIDAIAKRLLGS